MGTRAEWLRGQEAASAEAERRAAIVWTPAITVCKMTDDKYLLQAEGDPSVGPVFIGKDSGDSDLEGFDVKRDLPELEPRIEGALTCLLKE